MKIVEREILLKKLVKGNSIREEDVSLYRFLIGLLQKGANFEKVIKWTKTPVKEAKKWWNRLKKNGYFVKGKISLDGKDDISIHLMACCAMGFIERKTSK